MLIPEDRDALVVQMTCFHLQHSAPEGTISSHIQAKMHNPDFFS